MVVAPEQLFPGDSELSQLMRELDCSKTTFGPLDRHVVKPVDPAILDAVLADVGQ